MITPRTTVTKTTETTTRVELERDELRDLLREYFKMPMAEVTFCMDFDGEDLDSVELKIVYVKIEEDPNED